MAKIKLAIPNLEKAIKQIGKVRLESLKGVEDAVSMTGIMVESKAKLNVRNNGSTDEGLSISSIQRHVLSRFAQTVGTTIEYGPAVEFGRNPGSMPPVKPLQDWAKRKLGKSDEEAKQLGWAIALKIKKEGTRPKPFLFPAAESERKEFVSRLKAVFNI